MNSSSQAQYAQLEQELRHVNSAVRPLPGIQANSHRDAFIRQIIDSTRRIEVYSAYQRRPISPRRADPRNATMFDPLRAAMLKKAAGQFDEACWLTFLAVHFGIHAVGKWSYARQVYQGRQADGNWSWSAVESDISGFRSWLQSNKSTIATGQGLSGFGNHRKYESLDGYSTSGTGSVVESYVKWVNGHGGHQRMVDDALVRSVNDPRVAFDDIYRSMNNVHRFGRLARFDYLTTLGKLGLAAIEPGSAYMAGSSGPAKGARRLFNVADATLKELDSWIVEIEAHLAVGAMSMQVMEDSLCNWNKSPAQYKRFAG